MAQADDIASRVVVRIPEPRKTPVFKAQIHSSFHLTEKDLAGPIQMSESDPYGNEAARFRETSSGVYGLKDDAFAALKNLAAKLQNQKCWRDIVSLKFVEDALFDWCLQKASGNNAGCPIVALTERAKQKVQTYEYWIPVNDLIVQSEFSFGPVQFRTVTKELIDELEERLRAQPGFPADGKHFFERLRKDAQGYAAAAIQVQAEPKRAMEVAQERAEQAVSLLRFFSGENMYIQFISYCVPKGNEHRQGYLVLEMANGRIKGHSRGVRHKGKHGWLLDTAQLKELRAGGLDSVGQIFAKTDRTKLEEEILDALMLFSRGCLLSDTAERLLYVFASLESMLLRNDSEPITQAIGERLALTVGKDVDTRIAIEKRVKEAYKVRSQFVHHGKRIEFSELNLFLMDAWAGLLGIALESPRYQTKDALLDAIQRHKYRAGP